MITETTELFRVPIYNDEREYKALWVQKYDDKPPFYNIKSETGWTQLESSSRNLQDIIDWKEHCLNVDKDYNSFGNNKAQEIHDKIQKNNLEFISKMKDYVKEY